MSIDERVLESIAYTLLLGALVALVWLLLHWLLT